MSAGATQEVKYAADNGTSIYAGNVQPETLELTATIGGAAVTNEEPADEVNQDVSFKVSKGNRELGAGPRKVTFRFSDEADFPDGYKFGELLTLPILQKAMYDGIRRSTTGTYLGHPIRYRGRIPESIK